ncbi:hypothetical protein B0H17DRAFT_1152027 [Mycena rosella]|uniref:Uncharacterized protein n=1 Tax=Mycena rosella TaxID=1033263 RepID=A0AAD7BGN4_MYCRO|nr:hypothetical protein B0H17DRAFT_1152027 [Mycena rosella]
MSSIRKICHTSSYIPIEINVAVDGGLDDSSMKPRDVPMSRPSIPGDTEWRPRVVQNSGDSACQKDACANSKASEDSGGGCLSREGIRLWQRGNGGRAIFRIGRAWQWEAQGGPASSGRWGKRRKRATNQHQNYEKITPSSNHLISSVDRRRLNDFKDFFFSLSKKSPLPQ